MASLRQLAANRANGAKGGPKTEAGKQRSRLSSLKHGLTSSTLVVLPEEHEHEYKEVLRGFRESFNPADPAEEALVLRLAQTHWRSLRSRRVETAVLHVTANAQRNDARELVENCPEHLNPHEAIAVAFMAMPADHWQKYLRYDTTISRDFFKTLEALQKLQRTRANRKPAMAVAVGQAVSPAQSELKVMHAGQSYAFPELSENGIGSVSQNSTVAANSNEDNASGTSVTAPSSRLPELVTEPAPILSAGKVDRDVPGHNSAPAPFARRSAAAGIAYEIMPLSCDFVIGSTAWGIQKCAHG